MTNQKNFDEKDLAKIFDSPIEMHSDKNKNAATKTKKLNKMR